MTDTDQAFGEGAPYPGPAGDSETIFAEEVAGVTGWRLALAAVFGLLMAFAAAWVWYLFVKITGGQLGLLAIFIGFAVGLVVSLMSGGNGDARYGLLGAGLSAAGVIAGEVLIYANIELGYRYELSPVTIFIYILAIWEGWVIPRRSMRLVRENSGRINEGNWRPLLYAGLALLLITLAFGVVLDFVPLPSEVVASLHAHRAYGNLDDGDLSAAASELEAAVRYKPDWAHGHVLLGEIAFQNSLYAAAEQSYLTAVENDPGLAQANLGLAWTYLALDREDEARVSADAAKNGEPANAQAQLVSGYIYGLGEQWTAAEADLSTALNLGLEQDDTTFALILKAHSLLNLEDGAAALAVAETMITRDPNDVDGHFLSGQANYQLGDYDRAKTDLNTALTLGLAPDAQNVARSILAEME